MDNLQRVEQVLSLLLSGMLKQTDQSLVVANQRGEIVQVNNAFESIFGWPIKEVVGKPISFLMPTRYIEDHGAAFSRVRQDLSTSKFLSSTLLAHALCKDGSEKAVEISLDVINVSRRMYFYAIMRLLGAEGGTDASAEHVSPI